MGNRPRGSRPLRVTRWTNDIERQAVFRVIGIHSADRSQVYCNRDDLNPGRHTFGHKARVR